MKRKYGKIVTATIAKWFTDQGVTYVVGAGETLRVKRLYWMNDTANAGGTLLVQDVSATIDIANIPLDIAGSSGYIDFITEEGDDGLDLPLAQDIVVTLSGGSTSCFLSIQCGSVGK